MTLSVIHQLEEKVDLLIQKCQRLEREQTLAREKEIDWAKERTLLVEKNTIARTRVEAMIQRLKSIHEETQED